MTMNVTNRKSNRLCKVVIHILNSILQCDFHWRDVAIFFFLSLGLLILYYHHLKKRKKKKWNYTIFQHKYSGSIKLLGIFVHSYSLIQRIETPKNRFIAPYETAKTFRNENRRKKNLFFSIFIVNHGILCSIKT